MADVAVGLAKTAVTGTVNLVKTAIEEEKKLKKGVQRDLMLISDEFEMMQSFLHVANHRDGDDMSRTCVRQVRGMALDVEDCIETIVHLDNKAIWWRRVFPPSMAVAKPAKDLDGAVAAIERLKVRVEAMGQRNTRYGFSSDSGDSNSKPAEQTHHHHVANSTELDILHWVRKSGITIKDFNQVINEDAQERQVISVWASNLEITAAVMRNFWTPGMGRRFRYRAWVKVATPLNLQGLVRDALTGFKKSSFQQQEGSRVDDEMKWIETMAATDEQVVKEFASIVSNGKYLLILDGVSTMAEWDKIRELLPHRSNGSRIIVGTHQLEVAILCIGSSWRIANQDPACMFYKCEHGREPVKIAKLEAASDRINSFKLVGREADVAAIKALVDRGIICIWGVAGVGKTSVVRHIYDRALLKLKHSLIKDRSYSPAAWVNVSRPFNLTELSRSIMFDFYQQFIQSGDPRSSFYRCMHPIQECRDTLRDKRALVVLDGIQSAEELDSIKDSLLSEGSQSAIIVVTNEESVAEKVATEKQYNIKGLEASKALVLFEAKLGIQANEKQKLLVHKCGGLPGVICHLAGNIVWKQQLDGNGFMHDLETRPEFQDLFAWIHSYLRSCSDSVKPCIFYMPIFPPNLRIRRRRLVRRWIAEGYSRDTRDSNAEEAAEELFSKLVSLNMMQVPVPQIATGSRLFDSRLLSWCQVNGFLREYILTRPMEENLVIELESHCSMNSQRTGRHLTIQESWDRDRNVFEAIDVSRLRSLTVFGVWDPFFISRSMELLRVLDLENIKSSDSTHVGVTDNDVEEIVKLLPRLKFLSLRGCKAVKRLPASFGDLRQLQTLDVRDTSIVVLPSCLSKLAKLQYLRAGTIRSVSPLEESDNGAAPVEAPWSWRRWSFPGLVPGWCRRRRPAGSHNSNGGVGVPARVGHLTGLRTLGVVSNVEELKNHNLTQLHKFGVSGINRDNWPELCSVVSKNANLESLSVWFDKDNAVGCFDDMPPRPEKLRSLKLYGLEDKVPEAWLKNIGNLRKVKLHMATLTQKHIDPLMKLPARKSNSPLRILSLSFKDFQGDKDNEDKLDIGQCSFDVLEITCNPSLREVDFYDVQLDVLKLTCRGKCLTQFSGIDDELTNIREVQLSGSYDHIFRQELAKKLEESPHDIKPVLKEESSSSHV